MTLKNWHPLAYLSKLVRRISPQLLRKPRPIDVPPADMITEVVGFGFWRSLYEPTLPDPAWFVDAQWPATTRQHVVNYLKQGRSLGSWMGYSWCRFRCGASGEQMGAEDLTDGTYCWPVGLVHYVQNHQLRLPEAVVQHILAQPAFPLAKAALVLETSTIDQTWWAEQKGWQPMANSFLSESDEQARNYVRRFDRGMIEFNDNSEVAIRAREQMVRQLKGL